MIVSRPDLIEISRNKLDWYMYFRGYNCPVVPTYKVGAFKKNPDKSIFPAVVKPIGGSASQGVFIVNDLNELSMTDDSNVIQPYLFPKKDDPNYDTICETVKSRKFVQRSEISMQLIFTKESDFAGIFISKNDLKNGVPVFIDPVASEDFEYIDEIMKFVPVCVEKGVKGPVNIQGRITEKGLICFEMNMRFTGITGIRAELGFNEVAFLVDNYLGLPGKLNGYAKNKLGVRQIAGTTISRNSEKKEAKKTYVILGAGGYIGSSFVLELIDKKKYREINLVCRDSSYESYRLMFPFEKVNVYKETDPLIEAVYCQGDVLINFVGALAFESDELKYNATIFQFHQAQKIIKANISLLVNVSSQSVYNQNTDYEKDENADLAIDNAYAFQKILTELFFEMIGSNAPSIKSISLRFSRVIGTHFVNKKPDGYFVKIIKALMQNQIIEIPYPNNKTNLIDIRDAVGSILYIINDTDWAGLPKVMNVGGTNISIKDYCHTVVDCLGLPGKMKYLHFSDGAEVTTSSMLNSNLFRQYGWVNKYTIHDTVKEIISKSV